MNKNPKFIILIALLATMILLAGCSGGGDNVNNTYNVSGTVTFNGEDITEVASLNVSGTGLDEDITVDTDAEGKFTLTELIGEVTITATYDGNSKEVTVTEANNSLVIDITGDDETPDETAPKWLTEPYITTEADSSSVGISVKVDEAGTIYYQIKTDGEDAPTADDIKSADNSSLLTANTEKEIIISNFDPETSYDIYFVVEDNSNNHSEVKQIDVTTTEPPTWQVVGTKGFSDHDRLASLDMALDSHGDPYIVYRKSYYAVVMKYDGNSWQQLGDTGFQNGKIQGNIEIVLDSNDIPYVCYQRVEDLNPDYGSTQYPYATVMKYDSGSDSWNGVGGTEGYVNSYVANNPKLSLDSNDTPYVVSRDTNDKIRVFKYDGGSDNDSWKIVKMEQSGYEVDHLGIGDYPDIAVDNSDNPYVFYKTTYSSKVLKHDGQHFPFNEIDRIGDVDKDLKILIDTNDTPYVGYIKGYGIGVKKYDGSWNLLGEDDLNGNGKLFDFDMALDNNDIPYVVFGDEGNDNEPTVRKFNGSEWQIIGEGISDGNASNMVIAVDSMNTPYVAYLDAANDNKVTVMALK